MSELHPLRRAYVNQIKEVYGVSLWGDKNSMRTAVVAQRVVALGISYNAFIRLTVSMWAKWARNQCHPYPYWNMVTSDKSFEALKSYMDLIKDLDFSEGVDADEWILELMFAVDYIDWVNDKIDRRPRRDTTKPSAEVVVAVCEYLCRLHGVEFVISSYRYIAGQLTDGC